MSESVVRVVFTEIFLVPPGKEPAVCEAMMHAVVQIAADFGCALVGGATSMETRTGVDALRATPGEDLGLHGRR